MGAFVISPLPPLGARSTHRSGPFPPGTFCCVPIDSIATRSVTLLPAPAFPTHGYSSRHFGGISPAGTHPPSHHVAADTPPLRAAASDACRPALVAYARFRPSQPPEFDVTTLRPRS